MSVGPSAPVRPPATSPWIVRPAYDLLFFTGSVALGLAFGLWGQHQTEGGRAGSAIVYLILGLTHFGTTWTFYLDRKNLAYYRTRRWAFFYIPLLLIVAPLPLELAGRESAIMAITFWFSGWHVMKQSTGIASLYRSRLRLTDLRDRRIDDHAILAVSGWCLFARVGSSSDHGYEAVFQTSFGSVVVVVTGVIAGLVLLRWLWRTVARLHAHGSAVAPLTAFTLASFALFTPYLYVDDFRVAFMANLFGHYSQYLALVWYIHRQKYTPDRRTQFGSRLLEAMSQEVMVRWTILIGYALLASALGVAAFSIAIGLTWAHFFVDRYLFRFRDPAIREALLPYLRPSS